MLRPSPHRSFYVVVSRSGDGREYWCWEIRRKWKPLSVRLCEDGFRSHRAAELAGRSALEDFLNGLSMEAGSR
jgi:hypothetical protein